MAHLMDIVKKGVTDRSVTIRIVDSTDGTPETGVVYNTSGIDLWYRREGAAKTSITEATLSALTDAHSDGGFLHIGDGEYRLDLPDAAFASGANYVDIGGTVTGMIVIGGRVRLVNYDPEDGTRLGLTALPNAAADGAGGLPISDAGGLDLDARLDVAVSSRLAPTTAGRTLDVSSGGEAGVDWANVGSPTTTINLSGTTVKTATDIASDTGTLLSNITTILNRIGAFTGSGINNILGFFQALMRSDTGGGTPSDVGGTYDNELHSTQKITEKIDSDIMGQLVALGYIDVSGINSVPSKVDVLQLKTKKYLQLLARKDSAIATDNATELSEINANGGSGAGAFANSTDSTEAIRDRGDSAWVTGTALDAAGVRAAVGLASANLDTQLGTIDDYLDTEIAAIKAKTDNLPASPAATGDIPTAATVADAIWDEARSGHTTAGTFGESFDGLEAGQAATGTLSTTQMTTNLTEATDDHYNGRIIVWLTGALKRQATDITDYTGSTKMLTFTAVTEAPANGDRFIIV